MVRRRKERERQVRSKPRELCLQPRLLPDWQPEAVLGQGTGRLQSPGRRAECLRGMCLSPISSLVINNMTLEVRRQLILILFN